MNSFITLALCAALAPLYLLLVLGSGQGTPGSSEAGPTWRHRAGELRSSALREGLVLGVAILAAAQAGVFGRRAKLLAIFAVTLRWLHPAASLAGLDNLVPLLWGAGLTATLGLLTLPLWA